MPSRLVICIPFIWMCYTNSATAQEKQPSSESNKNSTIQSQQAQLAVISLKITRVENKYSVAITKAALFITSKNVSDTKKKWMENDFVCLIVNDQKQALDTLIIRQPMSIRYEFPTDDETIGTKTVELSENEILLRFPYTAEMKYLSISACETNGNLVLIDTLELPKPE